MTQPTPPHTHNAMELQWMCMLHIVHVYSWSPVTDGPWPQVGCSRDSFLCLKQLVMLSCRAQSA